VLSQEDEYAFLSQSVVLYCEFVEHPPGSTPVRQTDICTGYDGANIIIIIQNLYSAIMPFGGYRGAGGTGK